MTRESCRVATAEGPPPVERHRNRSERSGETDGRKSAERQLLENTRVHPLARRVLGWLAATDRQGPSRFEHISETYDRPNVPLEDRLE